MFNSCSTLYLTTSQQVRRMRANHEYLSRISDEDVTEEDLKLFGLTDTLKAMKIWIDFETGRSKCSELLR